MFLDFNKVFNPTTQEKDKQSALFNKTISETIIKYGNTCSSCKHIKYKQIKFGSSFITCDSGIKCKLDKKVIFSKDQSNHYNCEKYERMVY